MHGLPVCVGTYESDNTICNGDPDGETDQDRMPCAWRNRCRGLQIYSEQTNTKPELVVATLAYPALVALCEKQVGTHGIVDGVVGGARKAPVLAAPAGFDLPTEYKRRLPPRGKGRKENPRERARRGRLALTVNQYKEVEKHRAVIIEEIHHHFITQLRKFFPERRVATGNAVLVKAGTFYPVYRIQRSYSISWHCTVLKGVDRAFTTLKFKTSSGLVDMRLPIEIEDMQKYIAQRTLKRIRIKPWILGQQRSIARNLNKEGISTVLEILRRLYDAGILVLP